MDKISQDPYDIVTQHFKEINPGIRIAVLEPFVLIKTEVTLSAQIEDSVLLSVRVQYSNIVVVNVLAKDLPTQRMILPCPVCPTQARIILSINL